MVFSSVIFLFFFLPIVLAGYFASGPKWRNIYLFIVSSFFYFWGEGALLAIIFLSILVNYICGLWMGDLPGIADVSSDPKQKKLKMRRSLLLAASIIFNLGVLFYFKYINFAIEIVSHNELAAQMSFIKNWQSVILPLGVSFFTFQAMSYVIDVYRGQATPTKKITDFACYISCFPQLIAGPIVRYKDIAQQLRHRSVNLVMFSEGVTRFTIGLSKKVLIADTVGKSADAIFLLDPKSLDWPQALLGMVCYSFQIYYDFSGYSDMAIGIGRFLGFRFPENFNYPYSAKSIRDFWRRWHISLSTWFRDYLYIPLGGSRGSIWRTHFNLWAVFLLVGLWHGASWTFIIWGAYHGFFLGVERVGLGRILNRIPPVFGHAYSLIVIMLGWVIFRSATLPRAMEMMKAVFTLRLENQSALALGAYLGNDIILALAAAVIFSMPTVSFVSNFISKRQSGGISSGIYQTGNIILLFTIFLFSAMRIASGTYSPFLYFRF